MTDVRPLKASEVAPLLGIHVNTLKRIPVSDLPYFTVSSRGDRRYTVEDVEEYVRRRIVNA